MLHKSRYHPMFQSFSPKSQKWSLWTLLGECQVQEAFEPLPRGHARIYLPFLIS